MSTWEALAIALAGFAAGTINTVVGSGTLVTFPVLLAVGYPPVLANVTNTVGLVPGSLSGAIGYRAELVGQGRRLVRLGLASVLGGVTGAVLLLTLPEQAFRTVVPVLIGLACVLVLVQPQVAARLRAREGGSPRAHGGWLLYAGIYGAGVYGGYFGAAQGVLLIAVMGLLLDEHLQRVNAAKNVLALLVNAVAAIVFITVTDVAWAAAGLIAVGATIGGQVGAVIGRRIPQSVLRGLVVVVGLVAIGQILAGGPEAAPKEPAAPAPSAAAGIVQLRRDQVLERVEVALTNRGASDFVVTSLRLQVEGFRVPGPLPKSSTIPAGQVVNLPVPYGAVECPPTGPPRVGPARVTVEVRSGTGAAAVTLRLTARDRAGVLQQIATRACAVEEVRRAVDLRFADSWRLEKLPDGTTEAHGTLLARLRAGQAREITQLAGAILYGLRPDGAPATPLASVTPRRPVARIPVVVSAARCDGHTIGEIKKPYEFLVWVTTAPGEELAVTPSVGTATKTALRDVCAF